MVTSNMFVAFLDPWFAVVEKERFSGVHNDVDVSFGDVVVAFCEGNGIFQETLVYGWVEIFNVEYDEFVFSCCRI